MAVAHVSADASDKDSDELLAALADPDPVVRGIALLGLARRDPPPPPDVVIAALAAPPECRDIRVLVERAIHGVAPETVRRLGLQRILRQGLRVDDPGTRAQAVFALGLLENEEDVERLREMTRDEDGAVREQALIALVRTDPRGSGPALERALRDESRQVRRRAKRIAQRAANRRDTR